LTCSTNRIATSRHLDARDALYEPEEIHEEELLLVRSIPRY